MQLTDEIYARRMREINIGLGEAAAAFEKACLAGAISGDDKAQQAALDRKRALEGQKEALLAAGRAKAREEKRAEAEARIAAWQVDADRVEKIMADTIAKSSAELLPLIPVLEAAEKTWTAARNEIFGIIGKHRITAPIGPGSAFNPVAEFNRLGGPKFSAANDVKALLEFLRILADSAESAIGYVRPASPEPEDHAERVAA